MAAGLLVTGLLLGMVLGTKPRPCPFGNAERTERAVERGPTGGAEILSYDKGRVPLVPVKDPAIIEGQHGAGGGGCAFAHRDTSCRRYQCCTCSSCTRKSKRSTRRLCRRVASLS